MTDQMAMLLTRPAAQAARFADAARARLGRDLCILVSPVLEILDAPGAARLAVPDRLAGVEFPELLGHQLELDDRGEGPERVLPGSARLGHHLGAHRLSVHGAAPLRHRRL